MNKNKTTDKTIGVSNEELGYKGFPQVFKDKYEELAERKGMKDGEEYYQSRKAKSISDSMSHFVGKSYEWTDEHMSDISIDLDRIAEYFKLIDHPMKEEISKINIDFFNFTIPFGKPDEHFPEEERNKTPIDFHESNL
tara:strand:+ start:64 stop:477 length:414 start_codon:yes stop_codon:yes gene_type:complete